MATAPSTAPSFSSRSFGSDSKRETRHFRGTALHRVEPSALSCTARVFFFAFPCLPPNACYNRVTYQSMRNKGQQAPSFSIYILTNERLRRYASQTRWVAYGLRCSPSTASSYLSCPGVSIPCTLLWVHCLRCIRDLSRYGSKKNRYYSTIRQAAPKRRRARAALFR